METLIIELPSAIDCFYFHFKRPLPRPSVIRSSLTHPIIPAFAWLSQRRSPRYTKTPGPESIDLVNSITVIVVRCSVVMREKYIFHLILSCHRFTSQCLFIYKYKHHKRHLSLNIRNLL